MANKDFTSLESLLASAEKQLQSTLKNEVARESRQVMQEHVVRDVYDVYEPVQYQRKGAQGGLLASDNIEIGVINNNTIYLENIRHDGNRDIAKIIETGQGYTYPFEYSGVQRPFTENTRKELQVSDRLPNAIIRGMAVRGIHVVR